MCAVSKHGWVMSRYQNAPKKGQISNWRNWELMASFLNGYCQTRFHLIGNLELNKVSVTLYVNNR